MSAKAWQRAKDALTALEEAQRDRAEDLRYNGSFTGTSIWDREVTKAKDACVDALRELAEAFRDHHPDQRCCMACGTDVKPNRGSGPILIELATTYELQMPPGGSLKINGEDFPYYIERSGPRIEPTANGKFTILWIPVVVTQPCPQLGQPNAELLARQADAEHGSALAEVAGPETRMATVAHASLASDELVEVAARAMFELDGSPGGYTWAEMVKEDPTRAALWRGDARQLLVAVESALTASDA